MLYSNTLASVRVFSVRRQVHCGTNSDDGAAGVLPEAPRLVLEAAAQETLIVLIVDKTQLVWSLARPLTETGPCTRPVEDGCLQVARVAC